MIKKRCECVSCYQKSYKRFTKPAPSLAPRSEYDRVHIPAGYVYETVTLNWRIATLPVRHKSDITDAARRLTSEVVTHVAGILHKVTVETVNGEHVRVTADIHRPQNCTQDLMRNVAVALLEHERRAKHMPPWQTIVTDTMKEAA